MARELGHPIPEFWCHEDERDEQNPHYHQETGHVFQLATDNHAPFGIHRMVNEGPEETAHANGEEECESEKVGEGELLGFSEGSECDCAEGNEREGYETEKTTADMLIVEGMAAGL